MSRPGSDPGPDPAVARARRMWQALEPYHAVTYFAAESREATTELGLKGGWMSYFGLRAAPLGAAPSALVTAVFYGFHPARVGRAIPAAWRAATPAELLAARTRSVDAALRRVLGQAVGSAEIAEAAELAREAALAAPTVGRPLAAANAALPWPEEPHLVLWHAQTLLRESRGDAHVAALVSAGLEPCEALVAFAAEGRAVADELRGHRGWSPEEWAAAAARLVRRGLLDDDGLTDDDGLDGGGLTDDDGLDGGGLTDDGAALRAWVEARTDLAAAPSWALLGERRCERLVALTRPLVDAIVAGGAFATNNPMGLKPLA